MSHEFHVGQKVVCMKQVCPAKRGTLSQQGQVVARGVPGNYPQKGLVYTIRYINPLLSGDVLFLLEEVDNSHLTEWVMNGLEPGFHAKHFRPLQSRKTDISIFRAMLVGSKEKHREVS